MSFSSFCRKPSGRSKASAMTSGGNFNRIDSISSRRPHAQAMVESGPQNFHFGKNSHIHMTFHLKRSLIKKCKTHATPMRSKPSLARDMHTLV
jgi:hypothetical protein